MKKTLQIREFDTVICNRDYQGSPYFQYLDEKHFRELEQFAKEHVENEEDTDALQFMKIGYRRNIGDTITFNNYVGIIELPSGFQIEILPKVSFDDDENSIKTKRVFLKMLCCLKEFEGRSFGAASLNADKMNLYEVFINMYIQETRDLVRHGMKSAYIRKEENLNFYKGKMNVSQHIKSNLIHKERFFMQYDEYQINRAENRLIKAVLLKLQKASHSGENVREIRQLLTAFELVDTSINYEKDFSLVSLGRDMKHYELLIQWAKVFLMNKSFTTFSGDKSGKALLFPMEKVFESFVARWVKHIFEEADLGNIYVTAQDQGYFIFDEPKRFRLRPDIVVRDRMHQRIIVMDTKWKVLKDDPSINYGISQADMYQMYAYSKKYHTPDIWLIYPLYPEIRNIDGISFHAIQNEDMPVRVRIFLVDLLDFQSSLRGLYKRVFTQHSEDDFAQIAIS